MAFCTNCGSKIDDEARFCPDCGAPVVPGAPKAEPWEEEKKDFGTKINELNNTPDTTSEFDQNDIQSNKVMAVLAYLGILVLVPLFAARESRFGRKGIEICALPHESGTYPRDSPVRMDVR